MARIVAFCGWHFADSAGNDLAPLLLVLDVHCGPDLSVNRIFLLASVGCAFPLAGQMYAARPPGILFLLDLHVALARRAFLSDFA